MSNKIPYCIPHQRNLSGEERLLLKFLLEHDAPSRIHEIEQLKVVACCGCGKCPTILLGTTTSSEPQTQEPSTVVASYLGRNLEGALVGVVLIDRQGKLAELEAWSPEGADITSWPPISALSPAPQ